MNKEIDVSCLAREVKLVEYDEESVRPWRQLMYAVPTVFQPRKALRFDPIGEYERTMSEQMREVTVKREKLLEKIKENRENHQEAFELAIEAYRKAAIEELEAMLAEAREGKRIRRKVSLVEPVNQTREYDQAIMMLEMSVDEEITLQEHEFACFVMDRWRWKEQFAKTASSYLNEGDVPAKLHRALSTD
jgi:hypothetical protein